MGEIDPGSALAWQKLGALKPARVCRRTCATFDPDTNTYTVPVFGHPLAVALDTRTVRNDTPGGAQMCAALGNDLTLTTLWYLASAKDLPLTGHLIKPASLPGGQIFVKGTHVLPLPDLAQTYSTDPAGFIAKGQSYGGDVVDYGDAALCLPAFPRVPVTLILRCADEEFPANVDQLLDASCTSQLPLDIVWSTCGLAVALMLS